MFKDVNKSQKGSRKGSRIYTILTLYFSHRFLILSPISDFLYIGLLRYYVMLYNI